MNGHGSPRKEQSGAEGGGDKQVQADKGGQPELLADDGDDEQDGR
jgi:hypothetical protein